MKGCGGVLLLPGAEKAEPFRSDRDVALLVFVDDGEDLCALGIAELQELWWSEACMIKVCEGATLRGYRSRLKGYNNPTDWHFFNAWFEE